MLRIHQAMVVRFRSRGLALRPVQRIKHVVDSQFGLTAGANSTVELIEASDTPTLVVSKSVMTGSTVHGIYLKVEGYATSAAALSNCYLIIYKDPGGNLGVINPNTVGTDDDKRYVIHQEMVMLQKVVNGNPRTIFNGVIVIPKGYKRFGPNDELKATLLSPGIDADICLQCHYKEFR